MPNLMPGVEIRILRASSLFVFVVDDSPRHDVRPGAISEIPEFFPL